MDIFVLFILMMELTRKGYSATVDDVARLHADLFSNYKRVIPPVYQQNHAVHVKLSLFLLMIHDLDMKNQVLTTSGWLNVNWEDEFLRWNKSDYGGVEEIIVSQSAVWLPDILVENTAQNFAEIGSDSILVSIKDDGHISWEPGILTKTICEVNIGKYPFDYQRCEIKFLTWMHTNKTLDVQPGSDLVSLDATISNGEWDIKSAIARPYFYPSTYKVGTAHTGVKFIIELMRKRTFYVLNTIIPVVMLSLLNVLVFLLPASSGEKMALAVTVLLSFTVYLSIISEVMPKTSESISILAVYLTTLLSLSTMSVLSSGVVMNMIHQDTDKPVPTFLKCLVCCRRRQIRRQMKRGIFRRRVPSFRVGRGQGTHQNDAYSDSSAYWSNGDTGRKRQPGYEGENLRVFPTSQLSKNNSQTAETKIDERHLDDETVRAEHLSLFEHKADDAPDMDDWALITWMDVGSAVDTLLFWTFLGITVMSTTIVLVLFSLQ
ncbi:neuronal acetylcholine receptor subunit non-alpha-2-like [Physella acuta]|uniref:neuronal acetylcholine receptor subunit non-alpha-2-like n=1 Tax=Physella acuta TaxID=109671 RepID=UPI0027DEA021|nr:neuronal acetylcholine receptor subunit non-alpha-2-like [Physella acuta]